MLTAWRRQMGNRVAARTLQAYLLRLPIQVHRQLPCVHLDVDPSTSHCQTENGMRKDHDGISQQLNAATSLYCSRCDQDARVMQKKREPTH